MEVNAQTGNTVTMDLGNGYEAVYGQLKEVPVQEGNYVEQGELVGYLSEPTKYYSVEGCNLYFQLLKDGEPVNPMEYMDSYSIMVMAGRRCVIGDRIQDLRICDAVFVFCKIGTQSGMDQRRNLQFGI